MLSCLAAVPISVSWCCLLKLVSGLRQVIIHEALLQFQSLSQMLSSEAGFRQVIDLVFILPCCSSNLCLLMLSVWSWFQRQVIIMTWSFFLLCCSSNLCLLMLSSEAGFRQVIIMTWSFILPCCSSNLCLLMLVSGLRQVIIMTWSFPDAVFLLGCCSSNLCLLMLSSEAGFRQVITWLGHFSCLAAVPISVSWCCLLKLVSGLRQVII